MRDQATHVVGREGLLSDIVSLLAAPGCVVTLSGDPGVGKTTVFTEALSRVSGDWRWSWRCAQAEGDLGLSVLADLFASVPEAAASNLPAPQRHAVDVILFRTATGERTDPVDERLLGATTLTLLRALSDRGSVLLAIDDLQWCDRTSLAALSFALNRLADAPLAVLAATRLDIARALPRCQWVEVAPLPANAMAVITREALGQAASDATVTEIVDASAGNAFVA